MTIKAFRIPDKHLEVAQQHLPGLVQRIEGFLVVSAAGAEHVGKRVRALRNLEPHPIDPDRWANAGTRMSALWAAMVSEPLPDTVSHEARLILYADPKLELEFMGRGAIPSERHLPAPKKFLLSIDMPGGNRTYLFRRLEAPVNGRDARMANVGTQYGSWRTWIQDPEARVVISLGGGGFRLFAATPVLKAIDNLAGDRTLISEVWGSSGGAFLGHAYAAGFPLAAIDEFAFDLYNGRVPHLVNGSVRSVIRSRARDAIRDLRGQESPPAMVDWLIELEKRHPKKSRLAPRPFYAIASSTDRVGLTALTDAAHVSDACSDFMVACDPHLAVAASTAVPFVLRPVTGIGERKEEAWFDGSISDENPLALPYIKWVRERGAHPDKVPPKLKIVLVNLNLRAAESEALRSFGNLPFVKHLGFVDHGSRVLDMLLDSKTITNIRLVTATLGVEVLSAKLNLGWLNAQDPREIAKAIRSGRTLESWQIAIHGGAHDTM